MITAVDTSVILDILTADSPHTASSLKFYGHCSDEGQLVVCPVVWSELRPTFDSDDEMVKIFAKMNLIFDDFGQEVATRAGVIWKKYRTSKGPRTRILGDFMIGAHAELRADRLLTGDDGFYRSYFRNLKVLSPRRES